MENFSLVLNQIINKQDLTEQAAHDLILYLISKDNNDIQKTALLTALRAKGESVAEIKGAYKAMLSLVGNPNLATKQDLVDLVGTGGDGANLFNVSTSASLLISACGIKVAKHGAKSVSSAVGSADFIEALGIPLNLDSQNLNKMLETFNFCFMFAPFYHPAMKEIKDIRATLKMRTIFNILGPLCNPAKANKQLIGVYSNELLDIFGDTILNLQDRDALIVHSDDGLDEISVSAKTSVYEIKSDKASKYQIDPKEFGFNYESAQPIKVASIQESNNIFNQIINSSKNNILNSMAVDMVAINAGAVLYLLDKVESIKDGFFQAKEIILSGELKAHIYKLQKYLKEIRSNKLLKQRLKNKS